MARDAYLVKKTLQLTNDGRDLLGQIVCIHCRRETQRFVGAKWLCLRVSVEARNVDTQRVAIGVEADQMCSE